MSEKRTIRRYIAPARWISIVAIVLLLFVVVTLTLSFLVTRVPGNEGVLYTRDVGSNKAAYADVIYVSDWVYSREEKSTDVFGVLGDYLGQQLMKLLGLSQYDTSVQTYYLAMDVNENLLVLQLSNDQYEAMEAQRKYDWKSGEVPEVYRVYGTALHAHDQLQSHIMASLPSSTHDYEAYFGNSYLNCTETPSSRLAMSLWVWGLAALFFGAIALALNWGFLHQANRATASSLKALRKSDSLSRAAQELDGGAYQMVGLDQGRLGEHFLFGRYRGVALSYGDILLCYKKEERRKTGNTALHPYSASLMIYTAQEKDLRAIYLKDGDPGKELDGVIQTIQQKNPQVLLGATPENLAAVSARGK